MSLRKRTVSGVLWSSAARVGQQGVTFTVTAILAHLLEPSDFGTVAMAAVVLGFARAFADFGLGAALIQNPSTNELQKSTIFWYNLALGAVLFLLAFLGAPLIAAFYGNATLVWLTRVLAFDFLIASVGVVPRSLLQKELAFSSLAKQDIGSSLVAGVVAIWLALAGYGVWSLVAQGLTSAAVASTVAFRLSNWRPRLVSSWTAVRELMGFGLHLSGFNFVNYWARNFDNLLIGRVFGAASLGIYARSYTLMLLPISQVNAVITTVMFPALATIRDEKDRIKRIYLSAVAAIAFVCFPIMGGLLLLADPFVAAVFGEKWLPMVPIVKILCGVGALQCVSNPVGWIYTSQGRTDRMLRWGLFASAVVVAGVALGVYLGSTQAVAWVYLIASALVFYPCNALAGHLIGMRVRELLGVLAGPLLCTTVMMLAVCGGVVLLRDRASPWFQLMLLVPMGATVYLGTAFVFKPHVFVELRGLVTSFAFGGRAASGETA